MYLVSRKSILVRFQSKTKFAFFLQNVVNMERPEVILSFTNWINCCMCLVLTPKSLSNNDIIWLCDRHTIRLRSIFLQVKFPLGENTNINTLWGSTLTQLKKISVLQYRWFRKKYILRTSISTIDTRYTFLSTWIYEGLKNPSLFLNKDAFMLKFVRKINYLLELTLT